MGGSLMVSVGKRSLGLLPWSVNSYLKLEVIRCPSVKDSIIIGFVSLVNTEGSDTFKVSKTSSGSIVVSLKRTVFGFLPIEEGKYLKATILAYNFKKKRVKVEISVVDNPPTD